MKMKRALWLCLCLVCACAHADTTAIIEKKPSAINLRKQPDQNPRSLRLDDGVKAPQLKQQPGEDDGEENDKLPGGAVAKKQKQPIVIDEEKPLEKSDSRPIHRVYDPVTGLFCELVGDCHACPVSEKDEVYCRETSNRQEMRCPRSLENKTPADDDANSLPEIRFKACVPIEEANPFLSVLLFEFIMAGSLVGAFLLLRKEQQKHMSLFDLRKDSRQRGALLGSGGSQKGAD